MRSNFLLFTLEYPPQKGGVANYYENLVKQWPDSNIFVLAPSSSEKKQEDSRVLKRKLSTPWLWPRWLPGFWSLFRVITQKNIDHILVGQILPLGTVTYYLARIFNIKYTVILHGMDLNFAFQKGRKGYISRKILGSAEAIICSNSYVADLVLQKAEKDISEKIKVVNPGISPPPKGLVSTSEKEKLKQELELSHKFVILTVGRLVERKGVDKTIEALSRIQDFRGMVYLVAGTGPEENYLQKKKNNSPYKQQIKFLGDVSEKQKWNLLELCDILVMPARQIEGDFEGFGIVYLEANLLGKPVIAGQSGGVTDAVEHHKNGLVVNPEDVSAIKRAILELYANIDKREKLGRQGRERALRDFSWNGQIRKIYNFLIDR